MDWSCLKLDAYRQFKFQPAGLCVFTWQGGFCSQGIIKPQGTLQQQKTGNSLVFDQTGGEGDPQPHYFSQEIKSFWKTLN